MRRIEGRWLPSPRVVVVFGLIAVLAAGGVVLGARSISLRVSGVTRSTSCPDVLVLGAAGSGERVGTTAAHFDGVGPEVQSVWERISAQLKARGINSTLWADPYLASSVTMLAPTFEEMTLLFSHSTIKDAVRNWVKAQLDSYTRSVEQGATQFDDEVISVAERCPSTMMVAVGYSQGAMAVHSGEEVLAKMGSTPLGEVRATILIGDGLEVANSGIREFGSASTIAEGVATFSFLNLTHQRSLVHNVPRPKMTAEVCNRGDIVCNFSLGTFVRVLSSIRVHTSYVSFSNGHEVATKPLISAADWAASQV